MSYKIETSEVCASCEKMVLRDSHEEHVIINNRDYCKCEDVY